MERRMSKRRRRSKRIGEDDEEAKAAVEAALSASIQTWLKDNGCPEVHPNVLIEPLLNVVVKLIGVWDCPGCQIEMAARCAATFGEVITQIGAGPHDDTDEHAATTH